MPIHIIQDVLFLSFSAVLVISAFLVITFQHPVRSALSLVVCFFAAAGLWLLLTAEFLALILILVYVGAVMTLFLFVIMTLNIGVPISKLSYLKHYLPISILITALLTALLIVVLHHSTLPVVFHMMTTYLDPQNAESSNTHILGKILYTQYMLPFEITGVILLVAMIAAISLTLSEPIYRKQQNIGEQIKVKKQNRVRLIK